MDHVKRDAISDEAQLIREFVLQRVQAGADPRALMVAHAAVLGRNVAIVAADGYLESSLDLVIATVRYNALLGCAVTSEGGPEVGHA